MKVEERLGDRVNETKEEFFKAIRRNDKQTDKYLQKYTKARDDLAYLRRELYNEKPSTNQYKDKSITRNNKSSTILWSIRNKYKNRHFNVGVRMKSEDEINTKIRALEGKHQKEINDNEEIVYDLRNKNYNDLVDTDVGTKRILVVLLLPTDKESWINQDAESLIMKKSAYWFYLEGQDPAENEEGTTRIKIPKENLFSVENLDKIMKKIKDGGDLNNL